MRILITAGATWAKVDDVRILTNRFTGSTGLSLAKKLKDKGHSITLLINPHCSGKIKGLKVVYYRYFEEFKKELTGILKKHCYDAIIHSAAVSDYKLKNVKRGKIPSGGPMTLKLVPTEKVIKRMRSLAKNSLFIQFKLESRRKGIIKKAYNSLKENGSDFVVANALSDMKTGYKGFLINSDEEVIFLESKNMLFKVLSKLVGFKAKLR